MKCYLKTYLDTDSKLPASSELPWLKDYHCRNDTTMVSVSDIYTSIFKLTIDLNITHFD